MDEVDRVIAGGLHRIHGPLSTVEEHWLPQALTRFRTEGYVDRLPHIMDAKVKCLDDVLGLDARARHFVALDTQGAIVGAVRLLEAPFELEQLVPSLRPLTAQRPGHLEVSRLLRLRTADALAPVRLLLAAGRWAVDRGHTGFWALCSGARARVFRRLGMAVVRDGIAVPGRPGRRYALLEADLETLWNALEPRLPRWAEGSP